MRSLIFALSLSSASLGAFGAWTHSPGEGTLLFPSSLHSYTAETRACQDGSVWSLVYATDLSEAEGELDTEHIRYQYRLQHFDALRNPTFGPDGILVSQFANRSYTVVNQYIAPDGEGNVVVAVSDCRYSDDDRLSYTAYKVSPDGSMLWGEDGVPLTNPDTPAQLLASMNILPLGDGSTAFAWTEFDDSDNPHIYLQRLDADGNPLWDLDAVSMTENLTVHPYLLPSSDGRTMLVYAKGSSMVLYARSIGSDGKAAWDADTRIYRGGWGAVPPHSLISVASDGEGGALVTWTDDRQLRNIETPYMSVVKADGTLAFAGASPEGDVKLSDQDWRSFNISAVPASDGSGYYAFWRNTDVDQKNQGLMVQKVSPDGTLLWGETAAELLPMEMIQRGYLSLQPVSGGGACAFFENYYAYNDQQGFALRFDDDARPVWKDEMLPVTAQSERCVMLQSQPYGTSDDSWLLTWATGNDHSSYDSYFLEVFNADASFGPTSGQAGTLSILGYKVAEELQDYAPLAEDERHLIFSGASTETTDAYTASDKMALTPEGIVSGEGVSEGWEIGFTTPFAGTEYDRFAILMGGALWLGNGEVDFNAACGAQFLTFAGDWTMFGLSDNFGAGYGPETEIYYGNRGEGDNSELVVEFHKFKFKPTMWDDPFQVDFQLVIDAKGNSSIVFSGFESLGDGNLRLNLGARRGESHVSASGTPGHLTASISSVDQVSWTAAETPDGTTVRFNAPAPCVTPTLQPDGLTLSSTSTSLSGTFEGCEGADTYLVVASPAQTSGSAPVDGRIYVKGDPMGEAFVVSFGPAESFSLDNLPGDTEFTITVYSASSYGPEGPLYNCQTPLVGTVKTYPAPVASASVLGSTLDSITLSVGAVAEGNEVVVLYTPWCDRDNSGDHGLFAVPGPDASVGDLLPIPEGYENPYPLAGLAEPTDGGVVGYVGDASSPVILEGLEPSTGYYISVLSRDREGRYTTLPLYTGTSTELCAPYDGDSDNFPRFGLPFGWEGSDNGDRTVAFVDALMWDGRTNQLQQGTQFVQQRAQISRGDAYEGKEAWMVTPPVVVGAGKTHVDFSYNMSYGVSRMLTEPYNEWEDDDVLELGVTSDNGASWTPLATYSAGSHPELAENTSYASISADFASTEEQTVRFRLYWHTYMVPPFGGNMYVDRMTIDGDYSGIDALEDANGVTIRTEGSFLRIEGAEGLTVRVHTLTGLPVATLSASASEAILLPSGVYTVQAGTATKLVMIP